jgi:hypothetical protein
MLRLLPGASLTNLQSAIGSIIQGRSAAAIKTGHVQDRYDAYIRWGNDSVRALSDIVTASTIEQLVLTRRCWMLQSFGSAGTEAVAHMLNVEYAERDQVLRAAQLEAVASIERWGRPGIWVVPDTSLYIRHKHKIEDVDFVPILLDGHFTQRYGLPLDSPIRIVVPMVVVDELDGLKRSNRRVERWRAGYTLAAIDRVVPDPGRTGVLRQGDVGMRTDGGIPRGETTIEVLVDPPGHSRLPIADDEIIDNARTVGALVGRPVALPTYDTGQRLRAVSAGIYPILLRPDEWKRWSEPAAQKKCWHAVRVVAGVPSDVTACGQQIDSLATDIEDFDPALSSSCAECARRAQEE